MIAKAGEHVAALNLINGAWHVGNVLPLPFPDSAFSVVVSRFAFHHFTDPLAVLREMARVCTRPGRIVVADMAASDDPARAAALNRMERLRDPSRSGALTLAAMPALFAAASLGTL